MWTSFGWKATRFLGGPLVILLMGACAQAADPQNEDMTDDELLELVQRQTFRYFYDFGHSDCGMARERSAPAKRGTVGHDQLEHIVPTYGVNSGSTMLFTSTATGTHQLTWQLIKVRLLS